jgi:hypothetical protein
LLGQHPDFGELKILIASGMPCRHTLDIDDAKKQEKEIMLATIARGNHKSEEAQANRERVRKLLSAAFRWSFFHSRSCRR